MITFSPRVVGSAAVVVGFAGGAATVGVPALQDRAILIGGTAQGFVTPSSPRYQNRRTNERHRSGRACDAVALRRADAR